jgi:hypothetical protein
MSLKTYRTPNGDLIVGTLETLKGISGISGINPETGVPQHSGNTEVFWDDQQSVMRNGGFVFLDEGGDEWSFDELEEVTEV